MMKAILTLTAATAALLLARLALSAGAARRMRHHKNDLKGEIRRWEDEGGALASAPDGAPDKPAS